jgi:hypothetical protein
VQAAAPHRGLVLSLFFQLVGSMACGGTPPGLALPACLMFTGGIASTASHVPCWYGVGHGMATAGRPAQQARPLLLHSVQDVNAGKLSVTRLYVFYTLCLEPYNLPL